jgi:hypothetical protein
MIKFVSVKLCARPAATAKKEFAHFRGLKKKNSWTELNVSLWFLEGATLQVPVLNLDPFGSLDQHWLVMLKTCFFHI